MSEWYAGVDVVMGWLLTAQVQHSASHAPLFPTGSVVIAVTDACLEVHDEMTDVFLAGATSQLHDGCCYWSRLVV